MVRIRGVGRGKGRPAARLTGAPAPGRSRDTMTSLQAHHTELYSVQRTRKAVLLGAIVTVHGPAGFFFTNPKGGWEFLALWIAGLLALALIGDGALALKPAKIPAASGNRSM